MGNQPGYIPNSRSTRRAWRGMRSIAAQLHLEIEPAWAQFGPFFAYMGPRPAGTILVRRDRNEGFTQSNCAWVTPPVVIESTH